MTSCPEKRLRGLVLAGGWSSRMGCDKASLVHQDGRPMARRCHDLLIEAGCESVVVSLRQNQDLPAGLEHAEIVRDSTGGGEGPIAGILAGMRSQPPGDWVVVACDLPGLDLATLTHLISSKSPEELFLAYRSQSDGQPEPLCAIYSAASLPLLEEAVARGAYGPGRVLALHDCRLLELPDPRALDNANTPQDWKNFSEDLPEWSAELLEIWISTGNDFRGRHELGRLDHGIQGLSQVECVAGMGLRGDRYFGYKPDYKGQVTFFDTAVAQAMRERFSRPDLSSSVLRRNLVVRGVVLSEWVGKRFRFQGVKFEGSEECKPCYWMDAAVGSGAEEFLKMECRGGLRARILSDGILQVGTRR